MSRSQATRPMARPLSPHLTIYRWSPTMAVSILHRITGGALYFGTLLVAWWLAAAAFSERQFDILNAVFGSWIGRVVLFGYSWALIHHMLGGLRHLIWDTGTGLGKRSSTRLAVANIVASVVLTLAVWALAFWLRSA